MRLGIVEEVITSRHGSALGIGRVQPLSLVGGILAPLPDPSPVLVYNASFFEVHKGRIVGFDEVDGHNVLVYGCP